MTTVSLLDLAFFVAESTASPKHVAGLLIFAPPQKAPAGFAKKLHGELLRHTDVRRPFNRLISFSMTALPSWRDATAVDLKQHVFYHRLEPGEGDRKSLYALVAQLHAPLLDRSRPLWEVHVIDGLDGGRFALYQKMHHAYADGVTMARWTAEALASSADDARLTPFWTQSHGGKGAGARQRERERFRTLLDGVAGAGRHALGLGRMSAMLFLESIKLTKNAIALPFVATARTPLTGTVTSGRQFASAAVPMARVNVLRERTRSTLNHVALTCLDGALRRYLHDLGVELRRPITIQMPVSLRREGERSPGNKIGIIQVELSPPTDDPYVRLRNIGFSLRGVRTLVDSVAPEAIQSYTLLTGLVAQLAEMMHLSDRLPPMGNTLVSNVPGPREPLYLEGACMEEMHPISTLPPSNLLNITLFSYAGRLFFGLIATEELPELDRLGTYVEEAFTELERAVLDAHAPAPSTALATAAPAGSLPTPSPARRRAKPPAATAKRSPRRAANGTKLRPHRA